MSDVRSTPSLSADVCVIGAGPVGATLACRLAASGFKVAVVDKLPLPPLEHPDFDGRAFAVAVGSRAVLEAAGIWRALPTPAGPIMNIRVSDGRAGRRASRLHLHFDHRDASAGPVGWMVEARCLRVALNAQLHACSNIAVFAPAEVVIDRSPRSACVRLSDGRCIDSQLVVAADGRESRVRGEAGIAVTRMPYDQMGIVTAIAHERPHQQTALEHFLPGGPFAQLPMAPSAGEPNLSAIVWTERTPLAERLLRLEDNVFAREISRRLGGHLGVVRPVGRRWSYRLGALHAHRYVTTRLALIGDAAHGIHPIAGQGLNLGFRDVEALSSILSAAASRKLDLGSDGLLADYQRRRRADSMAMLLATDALDRLFSSDNAVLRAGRDVGISAVNGMRGIKRRFMQAAMGDIGAGHA